MHASASQRLRPKPAFFIDTADSGDQRDQTLLREDEFVRALRVERRRSERSRRPFILLLLDGGGHFGANGAGSLSEQAAAVLMTLTRDTDVVGWYRDHAVLAVLYTEIGESVEEAVLSIRSKAEEAISGRLPRTQRKTMRISVHVYPAKDETSGTLCDLALYPDVQQRMDRKKPANCVKRAVDVIGSLLALILLSPILLGIALAVKLTSKGPVFFRQERVGQYFERFTFLKFRSMYVNCDSKIHREYVTGLIAGAGKKHTDAKGNGVFKITDDPRITSVGRFLRRSSLDELPQFFNVLMGHMSLVGPRPPLAYEVKSYDFWHRRRLFEAKPGITGLWQVSGRCRLSFDDMVRLDLEYARRTSFLLDLEILLRTPFAVLSGDGAY
jgi:lipopolysaccharide/colanic/teichoic acid biosynthesis glycosyltransferase